MEKIEKQIQNRYARYADLNWLDVYKQKTLISSVGR